MNAPVDSHRRSSAASAEGGAHRSIRVLLAVDSDGELAPLVHAFRQGGFEPLHRRIDDARALERALEEAEWDLLVVDDAMPRLTPDELLQALQERDLDIPVILVSAQLNDARAAAAMRAGVSDYVLRGNLSRLGPAVERELREADNRRNHRIVAAELERVASRDPLTGLANRRQLEVELERACAAVGDAGHAFLYLDIDQFRLVNENCGHNAGDELIRHLAAVLGGVIRSTQTLARIGPDEFGALLENCTVSRAWRIAEQMRRAINAYRFTWEGHSHRVGVSIGVVGIEEEGLVVPDVFRRADLACHAAKDLGRNGIRLYTEEDADLAQRRGAMQWVGRLQQAIENDELVLFAQPIAPTSDERRTGHAELLVRLAEADGRLIEPGLFIPAAEQFELMTRLDRWVIDHALGHIAATEPPEGRWFINLSATSLSDDALLDYVGERLFEHGVGGECLCFEITETAAIANVNAAIRFMAGVRELGCAIALDDFGSGLSSFSYLKTLPADYLKIDGAFVRGMLDDHLDHTIVDTITRIGHAAGKEVVGESAEHQALIEAMTRLGVDFVQGHAVDAPRRLERSAS